MLINRSYGIHLAKVDMKTGKVLSNWTNLWNGTGGIVSVIENFMSDSVTDRGGRLQKVLIFSKRMAGIT